MLVLSNPFALIIDKLQQRQILSTVNSRKVAMALGKSNRGSLINVGGGGGNVAMKVSIKLFGRVF